ncbi:hypothetical protein [Bradyrhizobium stylosanthis]|nr:hypothetical protein [Bradyrhizobium stylosanthis]
MQDAIGKAASDEDDTERLRINVGQSASEYSRDGADHEGEVKLTLRL